MSLQSLRRLARALRPETKPTRRQTLLTKPESARVIGENFYGRPPAISKNVQTTRESIGPKRFFANAREAVYPFSKIDRCHRHQNAHLGSNLEIESSRFPD